MRLRILPFLSVTALLLLPQTVLAQTAPTVGLRDNTPGFHALVDARVVVSPGNVVERATVVVRDGVIESVTPNAAPPAGARVWSLDGKTVYAGFIDAYADIGMPSSAPENDRGPVNWNRQVRAFTHAADLFDDSDDDAATLRSQGFTTALAVPRLGMFRGDAAVVTLSDDAAGARVVRGGVAQGLALGRDNRLGGGYPTSAMGSISFIRQTFLDADWYDRAHQAYERNPEGLRRPDRDRALESLVPAVRGTRPVIIDTRNEDDFLRALRIGEEFSLDLWLRGSGFEYRILDQVRAANRPLIVPLSFPAAPNVATPETSLGVTLQTLRHWDAAPENPGRLAAAGVTFALTSDGLPNGSNFLANLRRAVDRGLTPEAALTALTTTPARLLGIERTHGTVAAGKAANLIVVDGDIFSSNGSVVDVWVDGRRYAIDEAGAVDARGTWRVVDLGGGLVAGDLELAGQPGRLSGTFRSGDEQVTVTSATLNPGSRRLTLSMPGTALGQEGTVRVSATVEDDTFFGFGELPDGTRLNLRGDRTIVTSAEPGLGSPDGNGGPTGNGDDFTLHTIDGRPSFAPINYEELPPAMEYGRHGIPDQPEHVLVRNATIWTQGPEGTIENADLLVTRGQVVRVGQGLDAPSGAQVIDASGKHVTPGLIDAHLHSGLSGGVNEGGSAIVPEVRIGDVLTANNIWMYRQLAGGLTTAHVMHGSANPIGGQNQLVKMRWGALAEDLKLEGAPRTVKFALGENVVRTTTRYPNTRMGVEQIIADHFAAAREYEAAWAAWEGDGRGIPPRRDLRLEALRDILNGEISVQSHSYRQDEILMLIRLAEEIGFQVDAFHHGVEAYRMGPELAAHGAAAVVWSDWGAFKIEAYNATTYNVRLLMDAGVVTSLHSDNSEIASRMNWEAAKMLRTGITEEQALALVTSSTAKVFGLDDRIGSLEPGKDADFVIWNDHPLSTMTIVEQTWIDGRLYYDMQEDLRLRSEVEEERNRLIQKALSSR